MNTSSSDTEYKKVRREVAETWPETRTREMALQILDAIVCIPSSEIADAEFDRS